MHLGYREEIKIKIPEKLIVLSDAKNVFIKSFIVKGKGKYGWIEKGVEKGKTRYRKNTQQQQHGDIHMKSNIN